MLSENFFEIILSERVKKMKKRGVINQQLSNALAGLGHGDYFLLCDAGFPIPKEVERVDLALTFGIPNMDQCLKAILDEIVVQKVTIAKEMKDLNDEGYQFLKRVFRWRKSVLPQSHSHTYQWGLAIQLWQYVLCATGNAVSCHNRV